MPVSTRWLYCVECSQQKMSNFKIIVTSQFIMYKWKQIFVIFFYLYKAFCCQSNILIVTPVTHHLPFAIHFCPCMEIQKHKRYSYTYVFHGYGTSASTSAIKLQSQLQMANDALHRVFQWLMNQTCPSVMWLFAGALEHFWPFCLSRCYQWLLQVSG